MSSRVDIPICCVCMCTHIYTYMLTYLHTFIYTHLHVYIYLGLKKGLQRPDFRLSAWTVLAAGPLGGLQSGPVWGANSSSQSISFAQASPSCWEAQGTYTIYIHTYLYACTYICMHTYICAHTCRHICIHIYLCMYTLIYMYTWTILGG